MLVEPPAGRSRRVSLQAPDEGSRLKARMLPVTFSIDRGVDRVPARSDALHRRTGIGHVENGDGRRRAGGEELLQREGDQGALRDGRAVFGRPILAQRRDQIAADLGFDIGGERKRQLDRLLADDAQYSLSKKLTAREINARRAVAALKDAGRDEHVLMRAFEDDLGVG